MVVRYTLTSAGALLCGTGTVTGRTVSVSLVLFDISSFGTIDSVGFE